jgi:uncharacterized protein YjbI with pentapeptide repeats
MISRRAITVFLLSCLSPLGLASPRRKTYRDSCLLLQKIGQIEQGALPKIPDHRPNYDDPEPLGVSFFRTLLENEKLANLTLPRTFFSRSEIRKVSFENTDLAESTLCWNDFIEVNFSKATLTKSDLRAAIFVKVRFNQADLRGTDLRRSSFEACSFVGADLSGAAATRKQQASLNLSERQLAQVSWTDDDGEEPGGG